MSGKRIIIFDKMDHEHIVFIYFNDWIDKWCAYSETIGSEDSPVGEGKTQKESYDDLRWQLDELHDK